MNEVVPDWLHREDTTRASGTALPNTIIGVDNAELSALRRTVDLLQEENRTLKAENATLREKSMTNFDRLQAANTPEDAANLINYNLFTRVVNINYASVLKWLKSRDS
jgi:hypothetical protein